MCIYIYIRVYIHILHINESHISDISDMFHAHPPSLNCNLGVLHEFRGHAIVAIDLSQHIETQGEQQPVVDVFQSVVSAHLIVWQDE